MTTFKIVFTLEVFLVLKPQCTADVLHSYLVFSIYLAKKKQIYISVNHFMYFCQIRLFLCHFIIVI
jgi:hypothetical protein